MSPFFFFFAVFILHYILLFNLHNKEFSLLKTAWKEKNAMLQNYKRTVLMLLHRQVRNGLVVVPDVFVSLKCAVEHATNSLSERYGL